MKGQSSNRGIGGIASKRREAVRVKTAKKRSNSSAKWLQRQLNDPYVAAAKEQGFRSRAAFKIIQLDEQFKLIKPGLRVVDLGAAPGGWSQVVAPRIGPKGKLVAIDILEMDPIPGVTIFHLDFLADDAPGKLIEALGGEPNLVLSDMAPSTTGHAGTDYIRIMDLAENALHFAIETLAPGGAFVCKLFKGGADKAYMDLLKKHFAKVKNAKPTSSRSDSSESYVVGMGFRR